MSVHDHPVRRAFDHIDVEPVPAFQSELRARLVADLGREADRGFLDSDVRTDATASTIASADVIELVGSSDPPRRDGLPVLRLLVAAAATVLLVLGLAVIAGHRAVAPVVDDPVVDDAIARAALLTANELGRGWFGQTWTVAPDGETWPETLQRLKRIPACVPFLTGRPTAVATFVSFDGKANRYQTDERVTVFPSVAAASRTIAAWTRPAFAECVRADAELFLREKGETGVTAKVSAAPPLPAHGLRQFALTRELTVAKGGPGVRNLSAFVDVFVQVGRAIVQIRPLLDVNGFDDPQGAFERTVSAAVDKVASALGPQRVPSSEPPTTAP